jgi:hypothetical protein
MKTLDMLGVKGQSFCGLNYQTHWPTKEKMNIAPSKNHAEFLKIIKFTENKNHREEHTASYFCFMAKSYYRILKISFKNGRRRVYTSKTPRRYTVTLNTENFHANLMLLHLTLECMLKALIVLQDKKLSEKYFNHFLKKLFNSVALYYPEDVLKIAENKNYRLLLDELSENFDVIRYCEGMISIPSADNYKKLSKAFDDIFNILLNCFEKNS